MSCEIASTDTHLSARVSYSKQLTMSRPPRYVLTQLVDQLLVASRFRFRDLWKAELFAMAYLIFNISYYYIEPYGSKLIYYILDWGRNPGLAVAYSLGTLLVLIPLFALVHYGLFR